MIVLIDHVDNMHKVSKSYSRFYTHTLPTLIYKSWVYEFIFLFYTWVKWGSEI